MLRKFLVKRRRGLFRKPGNFMTILRPGEHHFIGDMLHVSTETFARV
jgi:hypothetical protein